MALSFSREINLIPELANKHKIKDPKLDVFNIKGLHLIYLNINKGLHLIYLNINSLLHETSELAYIDYI